MSQRIGMWLAASAVLATFAGSAFGQGITATGPVVAGAAGGNIEFIGINEDTDQRIVLTFAAGTTALADNNANAVLSIQFQDATGANVGGALNIGPDDNNGATGLFRQVTGNGNATIEAGEVWSFDISSTVASSGGASLMQVTWAPAGDNVSLTSNADGLLNGTANDATDQRYELVRTRTTLSSAFINGSGAATECNLTFTFPLVGRGTNQTRIALNGLPATNPNGAQTGGGAAGDFTFVTAANLVDQAFNSGVAPAGTADINAASFTSLGGGQGLRFTFDSANSTLDTAGARFSTTGTTTVMDAGGNRVVGQSFDSNIANNRGFVVTSAQPTPSLTGARFVSTTRVEASFSTPVDKTALPTADFFDLNLTGGTTTNLATTGIAINNAATNAAANNVVVFDINANLSGATDNIGVLPNAVASDADLAVGTFPDAAGQTFTVVADENTGTTDMTDIFGVTLGGATTTMQSQVVTDGIVPSLQAIGYLDRNNDGDQDAVYFRYDEPMASVTSATGLTLRAVTAVAVNPFRQINATTGALVMDTTNVTAPNDAITITTVETGTVDPFPGVVPGTPDLEPNNSIIVNFNPQTFDWDTGGVALATEAVPGTGDLGATSLQYDATLPAAGTRIRDLAGNEAVTVAATPTAEDRAAPVVTFARFFTGDNQAGINQLFSEQDGTPGDGLLNNTITFFAGENFNPGLNAAAVDETQVRFGTGGTNFFPGDAAFGGVAANTVSFLNSGGSTGLVAGVPVSILPGSGVADASGNSTIVGDTATTNRVAPYCPLLSNVDGTANIDQAFMFDADGDGFADSIRMTMTQPIDSTTVQTADFSLPFGTITGATVEGLDIVLALTDGVVPMTSTIVVTYRGASDTTPIRSSAAPDGTGVAMAAVNDTVTARRLPGPDRATQDVAIMEIVGTITRGTTPVTAGTKIYAMIAAPHIYSVTATHNNVGFTVNAQTSNSSINAWNRWLFGIRDSVYLGRTVANSQYYENDKNLGAQGGSAESTTRDVIALNINASNLTNITFTGTGETTGDKVANGRASLCWDVLRATGGLVQNFFNPTAGGANGPQWGGQPIVSSAVVPGTDGRYELHVSAPVSIFGSGSRLSSVDRPVILIVEEPNGNRYAVSSVLTSINGAPVRFRHQSRSQSDGLGSNGTTFNINLNNVGTAPIYSGWNLVPFNRNSGFATTTGTRPVRVNGVSESSIIVPGGTNPAALSFTGALEQFVYWQEGLVGNIDGVWTRAEDVNFGGLPFANIVIDPDCFPYFAFTMTNFGVQAGSAINNFVGGYALGFFNSGNFAANLGCFQFGAPLTGNTLFDGNTPATTFPNNATTQGWGLFTSKAAFNPATGIGTDNDLLDFIFLFRNNGPNATGLNPPKTEVSSLDLANPTGTDNPNDTSRIDAGQSFFGHWEVP